MAGLWTRLFNGVFPSKHLGQTSAPESSPTAPASTAPNQPNTDLANEISEEFYAAVFSTTTSNWTVPGRSEIADGRALVKNLQSATYRSKAVPRLPVVVPQLLRSLRNPNASATDYVNLIKQDPVIASGILKMVNSAYYNPTNRGVDSFHRAVVILGLQGIRYALTNAVMHPIIECESEEYPKFGTSMWNHAMNCAAACQILARKQRLDSFTAYLAGLVHDMGNVTLFSEFTQHHKNRYGLQPSVNSLVYMMDTYGQGLSVDIARDWKFPEEVQTAIHDQTLTDKRSLLGNLLYTANHLCEVHLLTKLERMSQEDAVDILSGVSAPKDLFRQLDQIADSQA